MVEHHLNVEVGDKRKLYVSPCFLCSRVINLFMIAPISSCKIRGHASGNVLAYRQGHHPTALPLPLSYASPPSSQENSAELTLRAQGDALFANGFPGITRIATNFDQPSHPVILAHPVKHKTRHRLESNRVEAVLPSLLPLISTNIKMMKRVRHMRFTLFIPNTAAFSGTDEPIMRSSPILLILTPCPPPTPTPTFLVSIQ